jgi:uncharacterized protein (DUF1697 family)
MTAQIALLRAINVGGRAAVAMSDLREFMSDLGFKDVRSLLQSGNLVFDGGRQTGSALECLFEREAAKRLDLRTDFFVRSAKELETIVAKNPFRKEARDDPGHLVVMCRFCCRSRLKAIVLSDSVAVMRFATGAEHDGEAQPRSGAVFLFISA